MSVNVSWRGLDAMQRDLEAASRSGVPRAARELVNGLAFEARAAWQDEMRRSLTLRNKFTERRALVVRATTLRRSGMEARLGHTEPYMALLEAGKAEKASKRFRPIPTEIAAGQAPGSLGGGRKRAVRPSSIITRLGSLKVKGAKARGRKANNARAIQGALRSGRRLALLDLGRGKGVYRIKGGRRKPKILKLYDLSRRSTPMPRIPTLQRALNRALNKAHLIAYTALERQLTRVRSKA